MKLNTKNYTAAPAVFTHNGARAANITPVQQLRRLVMTCMLWEDTFYVDGQTVAQQISAAIANVKPYEAAAIAIEAREKGKLRHVPLLSSSMLENLAKNDLPRQ